MNAAVRRYLVVVGAATAALVTAVAGPAAAATPGVDPAIVSQSANPGAVITLTKTVHTPAIPPKPDVVLLVDTTGSMGGVIANVKTNLSAVIANVKASQPTAEFAVASYKDESDGADVFSVQTPLTAVEADVQAGVNSLSASGGGDLPEAWVNGLYQVSTGAISYRADSSRIVVLVGDAPSHDPSLLHSLADAKSALSTAKTRVVAVNVGDLDSAGQATDVVNATGGSLVASDADGVSAAILAGLHDLDVTVTPSVSCEAGLTATFDKTSSTVPSGTDATFTETLTVASGATQGSTLHCTTDFLLNGSPGGEAFVQHVSIKVNDVTPPTATCVPGPNPGGHIPGSDNPDGFYTIGATDLIDPAVKTYIHDTASTAVFGPYANTTNIKLVQAPGATPSAVPFTGVVAWKVTLKGDASIVGIDASGNTSTPVMCVVPPKK